MFSMRDQLPRYLLGKNQLTATVVVAALFSLMFVLFSLPFDRNSWVYNGTVSSYLMFVGFLALSLTLIIVSRRVMYLHRADRGFTYLRFIVWSLAEIVAVACLFTIGSVYGRNMGLLQLEDLSDARLMVRSLFHSAICMGVPYIFMSMYFTIEDKNNIIRVMNYGNVVSDVQVQPHEEKRITLFDNSGALKFSINMENLYFIESDDNYIQVWYKDSAGEIKKYMLRCRLKTIEESFADSDLVRCHRKYVVNMMKVNILKSPKEGYQADLGLENVPPLPISKTYEQAVLARFNSR